MSAYHALALALASPNWSGPSMPSTVSALGVIPSYSVRVWDCQAGAFATPELKHPMLVAALAFHPRGDRLATGCWDQKARVFATPNETGEPLFPPVDHLLSSHPLSAGQSGPPTFLDGGRGLLTSDRFAKRDHPAQLAWRDAETGKVIRAIPFHCPIESGVWTVAVSPDGKYFAVTGSEGAQIWEVVTGQAVSPLLRSRERTSVSAAFSPDGLTLLTACTDRTLRRWLVPGGKELGRPMDHPTPVNLVTLSPDGRFVATAQSGGLVLQRYAVLDISL
jgi:WD40 repeat protein